VTRYLENLIGFSRVRFTEENSSVSIKSFEISGVFCITAGVPLVMVFAIRGSPAMFALGTLMLAIAALRRDGKSAVWAKLKSVFSQVHFAVLAVFFVFSALTIVYSPDVKRSVHLLIWEFSVPIVLAGTATALFPRGMEPFAGKWLLAGIGLTAALLIADIQLGFPILNAIQVNPHDFDYNRAMITMSILIIPAFALLSRMTLSKPDWRLTTLALLAGLLSFVAIFMGVSETAKMALIICIIGFGFFKFLGKGAVTAYAIGMTALIALQPYWGDIVSNAYDAVKSDHLVLFPSALERIEIWQSYGAATRNHLLMGTGFGSSGRLELTSIIAEVAPEYQRFLGAWHPHNNFLQIWSETGIFGGLLLWLFMMVIVVKARAFTRSLSPAIFAYIATVSAIALISHGAWQAWWITAIGAGAMVLAVAAREQGAHAD
jgi:O-antigen ligase